MVQYTHFYYILFSVSAHGTDLLAKSKSHWVGIFHNNNQYAGAGAGEVWPLEALDVRLSLVACVAIVTTCTRLCALSIITPLVQAPQARCIRRAHTTPLTRQSANIRGNTRHMWVRVTKAPTVSKFKLMKKCMTSYMYPYCGMSFEVCVRAEMFLETLYK